MAALLVNKKYITKNNQFSAVFESCISFLLSLQSFEISAKALRALAADAFIPFSSKRVLSATYV